MASPERVRRARAAKRISKRFSNSPLVYFPPGMWRLSARRDRRTRIGGTGLTADGSDPEQLRTLARTSGARTARAGVDWAARRQLSANRPAPICAERRTNSLRKSATSADHLSGTDYRMLTQSRRHVTLTGSIGRTVAARHLRSLGRGRYGRDAHATAARERGGGCTSGIVGARRLPRGYFGGRRESRGDVPGSVRDDRPR